MLIRIPHLPLKTIDTSKSKFITQPRFVSRVIRISARTMFALVGLFWVFEGKGNVILTVAPILLSIALSAESGHPYSTLAVETPFPGHYGSILEVGRIPPVRRP